MPSNQNPLGALPARFRRQRLLIIGCGDVGMRVVRALQANHPLPALNPAHMAQTGLSTPASQLSRHARGVRVLALTRQAENVLPWRAMGMTPLRGDLDNPATLARLAGVAHRVLHLAPPPAQGAGPQAWWRDPRTEHVLQALARRTPPQAVVYASTSGVYGNCQGAWVDESRPLAPTTPRAQRRANAERAVRGWALAQQVRASVLRVPGIYALDRPGGTPAERLGKGLPVLLPEEDVYTNHIHADDLARACIAALWRGKPQRIYHASDNTVLKMGDYMDVAADLLHLPRPARISRVQAQEMLSAPMLSFMGESRRLRNQRLRKELRVALRYPTVAEGLGAQPSASN